MALKMRKNRSPEPPRSCALTECMAIIGGAWTANVIWNLRAGPRRFSELRIDIPAASPKVLTTRLRELEAGGILLREVKPTSPPSVEYSLTSHGEQLVPAIEAIVAVGYKIKAERASRDEASAAAEAAE